MSQRMDKVPISNLSVHSKKPSSFTITKTTKRNPIPSLHLPNEDDLFNNNFFIQDYDNANPYLRKNSLHRGKLSSKFEEIDDTKNLEQSIMSDRSLGQVHIQRQCSLKLPQIDLKKDQKQKSQKSQKYMDTILKKYQKDLLQNANQHASKSQIQGQSIMDTRIQTADFSIIQDSSFASLLKMSRNSIDPEQFSYLKISKITRISPELQSQGESSNRQHLKPRVIKGHGRKFVSLTVSHSKRQPYHNTILQEETTSSSNDEDQYIRDSVPGPGYYSIQHHSSFSKPKTNRLCASKNHDFGSKSSRFKVNKNSNEEDSLSQLKLQQYLEKQKARQSRLLNLSKKGKKEIPFNCKAQTKRQNPETSPTSKMISPFYYSPRHGIEQELIKKIQRNFKGKFGSEQKRFKTIYRKSYNLGPGSYDII